jgi:hypothetical protein
MQKHASLRGWRTAVAAVVSTALMLFAVAGLHLSAGMIASGGPGLGDEPTTGLWGADEGVRLYADRGPVEQHIASEVGRGIRHRHQESSNWENI